MGIRLAIPVVPRRGAVKVLGCTHRGGRNTSCRKSMGFEGMGRAAESMLQSVDTTAETRGDRRAPQGDFGDTVVERSDYLTANIFVALDDFGCDGNGCGPHVINCRFESLIGDKRRDAQYLQCT